MIGTRMACILAWWLASATASAQGKAAAEVDAADDFDIVEPSASPWQPLADLRVRGDHVTGLPNGRADLERLRLRARLGASRDGGGALAMAVALRASAGNDGNRDNIRNNDNERSTDVDLDQAWLRWRFGGRTQLDAGKAPLPFTLTSMLWDTDLRPVGVALVHSRPLREADRLQWSAGLFDVDHPLARGPRMHAAQLGWHWHEGAPLAFSMIGTYLAFDRIDPLARAGLGRGNPVQGGRYRHDYRLADLQLALRRNQDDRGSALEARLDLLRNLSAPQARDAARFSFTLGDARQPQGWEVGYAYQRIQAAATLAAVNSDDWWFHAGTRGHTASLGYGFDGVWSVRLSGFSEARDGLDRYTNRLLLDVHARW